MVNKSRNFALVDVETTGGDFKRDKIIEIAIVVHDGEKEIDRYESLVNPECTINPFIKRLTGINQEMVDTAPKFYEIAKKVVEMTEGCIFVAHNVRFDYNFIRFEFERLGYTFSKKILCTVKMAKNTLDLKSNGMDQLIKHFNIKVKNRHRAMGDVEAMVEFFPTLLKKTGEGDLSSTLMEDLKRSRIPKGMNLDFFIELPQDPGVYYMKDKDDKIIYIGKSNNIKKRLYQHFSAHTKKSYLMDQKVHTIDYQLTGSTFIAELLEASEIKKHLPELNRAQRKNSIEYLSYLEKTESGHYLIGKCDMDDLTEDKVILQYHTTKRAAVGFIGALHKKNGLCTCIQNKKEINQAGCLEAQLEICKVQNFDPDHYNKRFKDILSRYPKYPVDNCVILVDSRFFQATDFILIRNDEYKGFGTIVNDEVSYQSLEDFEEMLTPQNETLDVLKIIKKYLRKPKKAIRVIDTKGKSRKY